MTDAATVAILILVGVIALEAVVLGVWIWIRGQHVTELELAACLLHQEIERLKAGAELSEEEKRLEGLSDDELMDELRDIGPSGR